MMIATARTGLWNSRNDSTAIASKRHVPPTVICWISIGSWDETLKLSNILIPKDFKSSMPTIEELEKGLKDN